MSPIASNPTGASLHALSTAVQSPAVSASQPNAVAATSHASTSGASGSLNTVMPSGGLHPIVDTLAGAASERHAPQMQGFPIIKPIDKSSP